MPEDNRPQSADIDRMAVLCSGGDSCGMNACLRAVVRTGLYHNLEVFAARRGYAGLVAGQVEPMGARSVSGIINRGGTVIGSARCKEFYQSDGRRKAAATLRKNNIQGLLVLGGDGSFRGAHTFCEEHPDIKVVGVPATIDNDIHGTDYTIGYDTAINVAMDAIDKIRDTASSHERLFVVEVMGREAGHLALEVGIASGAEEIFLPESHESLDEVANRLAEGRKNGKTSSIVVVAEGEEQGDVHKIAAFLKENTGYDTRVTILGHVQRGGIPTGMERVTASRLGASGVEILLDGESDVFVGIEDNEIVIHPLPYAWGKKKGVSAEKVRLNRMLSI